MGCPGQPVTYAGGEGAKSDGKRGIVAATQDGDGRRGQGGREGADARDGHRLFAAAAKPATTTTEDKRKH